MILPTYRSRAALALVALTLAIAGRASGQTSGDTYVSREFSLFVGNGAAISTREASLFIGSGAATNTREFSFFVGSNGGDSTTREFSFEFVTCLSTQAPLTITSQPTGLCLGQGSGMMLSIAAQGGEGPDGGPGNIRYQWETSTGPAFNTWLPLANGSPSNVGAVWGADSAVLTVMPAPAAATTRVRCKVSTECEVITSNTLILSNCPADFNCSGAISVQDIFDFLAAYFSGAAGADFNNSGVISVQDIFDFLAAYFAGC